ncbi:SPOR domain-containing protein [Uliginosibacterium sp. H1]|uniref:SPOR domain-containing protein n=1 Tax=Uliginosibacterium sp. H1 TaxID=3114757 RepID=UPI002E19E02C|nr:SPOR domain-containing protein [Uliginosibacterium sp. H1]
MPENDAQLELKKRARRRLVGAAALAMAAAIILPVVMDKEPRPSGNELQIRIPSQEGGNYASRLITARPDATTPETTAPTPVEPPAPPAVTAPHTAPAVVPAASAPLVSQPPQVPAPQEKPAGEKPPGEKPATATKPPEPDRALAILEGKEPAASAAAAGSFYVQLGVYRELDNVRSVQAKAKGVGYSAGTEKVGDRTRVRVGPFKNRAAADAAVAKLKQAGLAAVVAPVR